MQWIYTAAGLLVGFTVGLTGVGGGSLMTPILVLAFGISPAVAVGTDLLYASITKTGGTLVHGRRGSVDWKIVGWLSAGSLPAALACILLLRKLGVDSKHFSSVVTYTLGIALLFTAVAVLFKEKLRKLTTGKGEWRARWLVPATIATGVVLGVLVSISSVGAGALGMVALCFLYPEKPTVHNVGTDIAHAVPLTAVAGLGHAFMGTVNVSLLGSLLLGSLPGIYLGSRVSTHVPDKVLRPILASMLAIIGGRLVF
ncbi:sulfite exporter TauE/SafE family protein [Pendulispora brunnea]|uniref:Probable membrane transporter protein n=1 Tax=Pendulispora brunnea TaxID=2905690 RepID=A0ABZ2K1M8_9BACT